MLEPDPNYGTGHTIGIVGGTNILGLALVTGKKLYSKKIPAEIGLSRFSGNGYVYLKLKDGHWYEFAPNDGDVVLIKKGGGQAPGAHIFSDNSDISAV